MRLVGNQVGDHHRDIVDDVQVVLAEALRVKLPAPGIERLAMVAVEAAYDSLRAVWETEREGGC